MEVPFPGRVSLDARMERSCDCDKPFIKLYSDSPATKAMVKVVGAMEEAIEKAKEETAA